MDKQQQFIHGIDGERAKNYLKEIGVYEAVLTASQKVFGDNYPTNDSFLFLIAANAEYNKRNKQVNS